MAAIDPDDREALGERAADLLSRLIAIDTTNPPGNEQPAADFVAGELDGAGFECELLSAEPGRPNVVARLRGADAGPNLCLLGHSDVVPAKSEEWSFDPFGGEIRNGEVLGRGAQDMKGQVASELAAALTLAEGGWRPGRGDLLVVVPCDEEMGGHLGARWLCQERPDAVRCEWVVNEGGGIVINSASGPAYTVCIGEKGVFRFDLIADGTAGHASLPKIGDNALLKLAPYVARLSQQPETAPDDDAIRFLEALTGETEVGPALERLHELDPVAAAVFAEPMLGVTVTPTRAHASDKDNVIPSRAEVLVDCRVPPGMGEDEVRATVERTIGEGEYRIEFQDRVVGNRSDPGGPLYEAIDEWVGSTEPGAIAAPMVMPGFSDSHWFRQEFGATAFGFFPQRGMSLAEAMPLIHGADERIKVADLALAADFFSWLPRKLLA